MAGDWIKMGTALRTHPKVVRVASALKADRLRVVGGLHAVWCLFDEHSEDGSLVGYTPDALDELIGWAGFSAALASVEWMEIDDDGLHLPRFDAHNGASAKRRAQETERKRESRKSPQTVREVSASDAVETRTREEKRREEEEEISKPSASHPPRGGRGARFEEFWLAWPKCERKHDRAKCLAFWRLHSLDEAADAILVDVRTKRGTTKWQEGYIEAPLVYLRGRRWEDEVTPDEGKPGEAVANWWDTGAGIRKRGQELGLGDWSETEQFPTYRARVFAKAGDGPWNAPKSAGLPGVLKPLATEGATR